MVPVVDMGISVSNIILALLEAEKKMPLGLTLLPLKFER